MLNEDRIVLMTRMAAFTKHEGRRDNSINSYFRGDYVGLNVIKSIISASIIYVILLALYIAYNFELVLSSLYNTENLLALGDKLLMWYVILIVVYAIISYIVYSYRYAKMRKELKTYYNGLKRLSKMYEKEQQTNL